MKTAENFKLPVVHLCRYTAGAYPGIRREERCQSEAIGRIYFEMRQLEVPIITTIIGEGGSGGALAISIGDQVLMFAIFDLFQSSARKVAPPFSGKRPRRRRKRRMRWVLRHTGSRRWRD